MALRFRRGIDELGAREIGRDELGAIQTLLAIVDASASTPRWIR